MRYMLNYSEYVTLCKNVLKRWAPIFYHQWASEANCVLWRHDIDYSPRKALALAEIEASLGMKSTFFVLLHSPFYNALDSTTTKIIKNILDLGHDIGLHFDLDFYKEKEMSIKSINEHITAEKMILEYCTEHKTTAFSFHNPTVLPLHPDIDLTQDKFAGLYNASGRSIAQKFLYASDSRGGWHRRDLPAIIDNAQDDLKYLHVLTHGCLWSAENITIQQRLSNICTEEYDIRLKAAQFMAAHWKKTLDENLDKATYNKVNTFFL